jgi:hypothetical protein
VNRNKMRAPLHHAAEKRQQENRGVVVPIQFKEEMAAGVGTLEP